MVARDSLIYGIPLDPADPSDNAMIPMTGLTDVRDIEYDDQQQLIYWVEGTVSETLKLNRKGIFVLFIKYLRSLKGLL